MFMSRFIIYALVDPRSGEVRYIGRSSSGLERPKMHRRPDHLTHATHKVRWIKQLLAEGLDYEIRVLEECSAPSELNSSEMKWIALGRESGWPLTNHTDGGGGMNGWKPTDEQLARITKHLRGLKKTPEQVAKRLETMKGRKHSPAHVEKIRAALKAYAATEAGHARLATLRTGAKNSDEARAKLRAANLGLVHSPERCATNAAARRGKTQSQETRDKRSASLKIAWARRKAQTA